MVDERGASFARPIDRSIGPVWEANHVWLIYILVFWWTGFPEPSPPRRRRCSFRSLSPGRHRAARRDFAFRKYSATLAQARLFGAVFAGSSLITPFFLGVRGRGRLRTRPRRRLRRPMDSWLHPTSLFGGRVAVGTCVFLAGVFLTADAAAPATDGWPSGCVSRTLGVGVVTGRRRVRRAGPDQADARR